MIAIIGGGIIGLSIGWLLAKEGLAVDIYERSEIGQESSKAAAGMLSAELEYEHGESILLPVLIRARDMWRGFTSELEKASGIDIDLREYGTLMIALDSDERRRLEFQLPENSDLCFLSGKEIYAKEPHLASGIIGGIFSKKDKSVNNRQALKALGKAFTRAGGNLHERISIDEIVLRDDGGFFLSSADNNFSADKLIIAAGAWSGEIKGLEEHMLPAVRPIKGQMLSLNLGDNKGLIKHSIRGLDCYIVPKSSGYLYIGSTVEDVGFERYNTAGGIYDLLDKAISILPSIEDMELAEIWTGLRPGSRDDMPIIGVYENMDNLIFATGHFRHGILLAPMTAMVIRDYVVGGVRDKIFDIFSPARFN